MSDQLPPPLDGVEGHKFELDPAALLRQQQDGAIVLRESWDKHERRENHEKIFDQDFIKKIWPIIEPGKPYVDSWHIDCVCEHLQGLFDLDFQALLINIPPRLMKSIAATIAFPCWGWAKDPKLRYIFASYSKDLSVTHSMSRRAILESDWYQENWGTRYIPGAAAKMYKGRAESDIVPWVRLKEDQNVKAEFMNTQRGVMFATSIGGTLTGKGGDFIIVDDPHNPQQALSDIERETAIQFYDQTLSSRLDNPKTGRKCVIMQRLHDRDLAGHILEDVGGYVHLMLPMEATKRTFISFPKSKRLVVREEGDILQPSRFTKEFLAEQRNTMRSGYFGQYQQDPNPPEGAIWKRRWFENNFYEDLPTEPNGSPIKWDAVIQSWDAAFKDGDDNDYVVGQVWGIKHMGYPCCGGEIGDVTKERVGYHCFLLDQIREHLGFNDTCHEIRRATVAYPETSMTLIEDKANGSAIIETLQREFPFIVAVQPSGGKVVRAEAASPAIANGFVHIPKYAVWVHIYMNEVCKFDKNMKTEHDDQVDSTSQFLIRVSSMSVAAMEIAI